MAWNKRRLCQFHTLHWCKGNLICDTFQCVKWENLISSEFVSVSKGTQKNVKKQKKPSKR